MITRVLEQGGTSQDFSNQKANREATLRQPEELNTACFLFKNANVNNLELHNRTNLFVPHDSAVDALTTHLELQTEMTFKSSDSGKTFQIFHQQKWKLFASLLL